jgi:DNA-binding response OmpR family regulator
VNKILLIEDDVIMGDMLCMYLSEEGYEVKHALNGADGLKLLEDYKPDVLLLDLLLPDCDGTELCARIRRNSDLPIMIVSMKTEVSERVNALKTGADDYLCKPFSLHELTARVHALLRRAQSVRREATVLAQPVAAGARAGTVTTIAPGGGAAIGEHIHLDLEKRQLYVGGQSIETTFSEFEIMKLFIHHAGKVFSREDLINAIRGFDSYVTDRAIDVHIVNLRKKIEADPRSPRFIKTVWGVGYKFIAEP